jgi:heptosyltransferase I
MATLTFAQPPASLCILRLSAIGDVTHMLPIVATLQQQWPETEITWIIGNQLVKSLPGIKFIIFDKHNGAAEYLTLRRKLSGQRFDLLLMMQVALRANLISLLIKSDMAIGYDRKRARDFESSRGFAQEIIGQQPAVAINPCSSARANNWRNWPEKNYSRVIDYLSTKGIRVIITGGPAEEELLFAERVIENCDQKPVNLVGKTSLTWEP